MIESLIGVAIVAVMWAWWQYHYGGWYWRRQAADERRRLLERFPDRDAVEAVLTIRQPCGCTHRWGESPPNATSCPRHSISSSAVVPIDVHAAWRAREILQREGRWTS